jgi:succinate dehydrogenase / fumarate reductase cytochrome b subunit
MSSAAAATTHKADPGFVRARLGSLLAIAPLGVWTVVHIWNNLSAFSGAGAWERSVTDYGHPIAFFASTVAALVPLVLHAVWGVGRLFTAKANVGRYRTFANLKYVLQRLSAIGLMLFLGAHLWKAMLEPRLMKGHAESFADIATMMRHHPPTLGVYVLGVLGVAYHLGNGLHTFMMGWGVVSSRAGLKRTEWVSILAFLVILAMGWGAIYALWDAGGAFSGEGVH